MKESYKICKWSQLFEHLKKLEKFALTGVLHFSNKIKIIVVRKKIVKICEVDISYVQSSFVLARNSVLYKIHSSCWLPPFAFTSGCHFCRGEQLYFSIEVKCCTFGQ